MRRLDTMSLSHGNPARLLAPLVALIAFCFSTPAMGVQSSQSNESVLDQLSNSLKFLLQRIAAAVVEAGGSPIFAATVVGTDQKNDLAVLQMDATDLPTIGFANYEERR